VALAWFVALPALESRRLGQAGVMSFCTQNLVAIYGLTWLSMAPYAKYLVHSNMEYFSNTWSLSRAYEFAISFFELAFEVYTAAL
jgi:predicted phosphohydrolase